jgi:GDPmannose 4,6-dehydratase
MHLVVGHKGQDGSILRQQLLSCGQTVYGLGKGGLEAPDGSVDPSVSLADLDSLRDAINRIQPEEVYYLAALHHSSQSVPDGGSIVHGSLTVNTLGLAEVLEAIRLEAPSARLFYAASSQVFGDPETCPQTEETPFAPRSPYAVSKVAGIELCRYFRRAHGIFAACGYLYNHESPTRPASFLSRKTAIAAAAIAEGRGQGLVLGKLDAVVDLGYAPEYTEAMRLILSLPDPADFIVASGQATTVQDFVEAAFTHVGLDWRDHVTVDPALIRRPRPALPYVGDARRLSEATGWRPRTTAAELAANMVDAERRS